MKNFSIAFVVFLVWSFFGLWIYSWLQPKKNNSDLKIEIAKKKETDATNKNINKIIDTLNTTDKNSLIGDEIKLENRENLQGLKTINHQGDIIFIFSEGISIIKNTSEIIIPPAVIDFKYKLNTYLLEHPDQELYIYSLYSPSENIESPNLGIQRSQKIKELLIITGITEDKIVVKSLIRDITFKTEGIYKNAISFSFKPVNEKRLESIRSKLPENKTVYPNFSSTGIMENDTLKTLLKEIIIFNKNNPKLKIEIIGHTDNIGNSADNYSTGLKYARQVRWYLISKGNIDQKQITASSKGESQPIADNNTKRGRDTNKRIEVIYN